MRNYKIYSEKGNIKMRNDEKSVSPYKFPQTPYPPFINSKNREGEELLSLTQIKFAFHEINQTS